MLEEIFDINLSTSLYTAAITLVVVYSLFWLKDALSTPGPWGIPFLGYFPFLRKDYHLHLHNLAKKYGDVYVLNVAGQNYVHLNSMKAVKEAHVVKADYFPNRCPKYSVLQHVFDQGIAFSDGDKWRAVRKFVTQSLREVGIGANKTEFCDAIQDAMVSVVNDLRKSEGKVTDLIEVMTKPCTEVVERLTIGNDISEDVTKRLQEAYLKTVEAMFGTHILLTGNFARYFIMPWIRSFSKMREGKVEVDKLLLKIIRDHEATYDAQNPRDVIDIYIRDRKTRERKGDPIAKDLTDQCLASTLIQMYGDGSLSIALFVALLLKDLAYFPSVQDAIYQEIIKVVGTGRYPSQEDRDQLPYTTATLWELLRTSAFFPVSPSLECSRDTTLLGVPIKKGTITLMNLYSIHHDPEAFKDPEKFDPNRFVSDSEKVSSLVFFGVGKRACAGESMVMCETLLLIAAVLQNFEVRPEKDLEPGSDVKRTASTIEDVFTCNVRVFPRVATTSL